MGYNRNTRRASRWLAVIAAVSITASALTPTISAQTVDPAPASTIDVYPRASTEIQLPGGEKVRTLKTVKTPTGREAVADRLIVVFRSDVSEAERTAAHLNAAARGGMAAKPLKALGPKTQLVDVSGARSLEAAIEAYRADSRVTLAAPDLVMHAADTPSDPLLSQQWALAKIKAPPAWSRSHGSSARRIAILDSGIDESNTNADLANLVVAHKDFTGSTFGTQDKFGHGTHVAGIAGAITNNRFGAASVAFDTRLLNGKVLDDVGNGSMSMLIDAIRWAKDNGAEVINMSLGGNEDCNPSYFEDFFGTGRAELRDAINEAFGAGAVLVASAGNNDNSQQQWPAACPSVLSVASTDSNDARGSLSNFGSWVDVAAPGVGILSTALPLGTECANGVAQFAQCSGTSMASPMVASLAALVKTSCGFTSPADVIGRIEATADRIPGTGSLWIYGRINALGAVCFPAPSNLHLGSVTSNSIQILWTDGGAPADTQTQVYFRPHNATSWSVQLLAANATSWVQTGLAPGSGFDYRVRDCDANGCSGFSNTISGFVGTAAFPLTVTRSGTGLVTSSPAGINCGGDCSDVYPSGTVVTLDVTDGQVVNGIEWTFTGWSGACSGRDYTCVVTMDAAKSVTATFKGLPVGA